MGLAGALSIPAGAQTLPGERMTYDFRGESLERVLDRIARDTGTDLVYDPELVRGRDVFKRITNQPVSEMLRMILSDYDLDYITLSSGTIVIIRRAEEAPAYGTLSGIIVDSRTGEPLPGATVLFADAAGGTSTGQMGQFSINRMLSGEHTLIFSYVGYTAVTKQIIIIPGRQMRETIELQPRPVDISPIVVEAHRPQIYRLEMSDPGEESTGNYSRWSNTPIMDLSIIPGVKSGVPMAEIALQGGQESEHRLYLDGAPVYNTSSAARIFSPFSPYAIGSVHVDRAGYDARRGSQIAGVIGLTHDLPAAGQKGAMVQADQLSATARGDVTHSFNDGSSVSAMSLFRTNIWGVYSDPVLKKTLRNWDVIDPLITNSVSGSIENAEQYLPFDHQSDLSFHDFHTAVRFKPNTYNTLHLSVYDSENRMDTAVLNRSLNNTETRPYLYAAESYSWDSQMMQLGWSSLPGARLSIDSQISYSASSFRHSSELGYGVPGQFLSGSNAPLLESDGFQFDRVELPADIQGNEIGHLIIKSDIGYSVSPAVDLNGGLQFDRVSTSLESGGDTDLPTFSAVESSMISGYLSVSSRFARYWHLVAGNRFTYTDGTDRVYLEPRLSIQVDRPASKIGYWSGKISGGLYRQFINEYRVSNSGASSVVPAFSVWSHAGSLPVPKAYHLTGSWYLEPTDDSSFRVETYLKWQPVTSITSYRSVLDEEGNQRGSGVDIFAETTSMNASGIGIRYRQSLLESKLTLITGYDFSHTAIDMDTRFGDVVSAPWNDPHRAQIRAVWGVSSGFTLIGKWQGIWGRRWAYRDSYYSFLQLLDPVIAEEYDFSTPDDDPLPHFSQIDVSAVYRPGIGAAMVELRVDLVNILNRRNPVDRYLRPVAVEGGGTRYDPVYRRLPGFYPSLSVRVSI